jgi:Fe-S cluster assembly scaffold protein SufB
MLFYMETRGVDEETACEMLARAKIDSVIRKIPDESIREKILSRIQRGE